MGKRLTLFIFIIITLATGTKAQIFYDKSEHARYADSIRNEFDNGPYFSLYRDNYFTMGTSLDKPVSAKTSDVKFQVSIAQRVTKSTLPFKTYLFLTYTQKCFWNVFEESLPMRDINFNPGIGLSKLLIVKGKLVGMATLLLEHESNGKSDLDSRSWNRISLGANVYITPQVMVHGKCWIPIIDGENNKDILDYKGIYETGLQFLSKNNRWGFAVIATKRKGWNLKFNYTAEINYRMFKDENQYLFLQFYNGYGENLLDYKQHHTRLRAGIVIKPKFFSNY